MHRVARWLLTAIACLGGTAQAQFSTSEVQIEAGHHALGDALRAVLVRPDAASAAAPVPGCLVVHGSGGLFRENAPGEACGPALETNFRLVAERLAAQGVAALLPDSFSSRDARFCEDNDDAYFAFVAPPFHHPDDGTPARDGAYDRRRQAIRTLDLLAAMRWLCARDDIDCRRTCLVGASNGGSAVLGYAAQDLQRHLIEFLDTATQRVHESASDLLDRQVAFAHFPALAPGTEDALAARPMPRFVHAISPGCRLRELVPDVLADDPGFDPELHRRDLYYPEQRIALHLEIGTADDVPEACYAEGLRARQAAAYEAIVGVASSRYRVHTYDGAGHDLLAEQTDAVHARLDALVQFHFFDDVFHDGFETP